MVERELRFLQVELAVGEQDGEVRVPGVVRVDVGRDVDALRARRVQHAEQLRGLAPPVLHGELHVRDFDRDLRFAADVHDLVDRLPEIDVFAADVADVAPVVALRHLRELDDLLGRRVDARVVFEAGGEPERAGLHFRLHELAHLLDFLRRRMTPEAVLAHDFAADVAVADVGRDVDRRRRLFHPLEEFRDGIGLGPVLAGDDRRHALAHDRRGVPHLEQAVLVVAVHVDEAGRERQPLGIHDAFARLRRERPDLGDPVAVDAHGARARGTSRPVHDRGVDDQRRLGPCPDAGGEAEEKRRAERSAAADS